jgi:hypothetical protein
MPGVVTFVGVAGGRLFSAFCAVTKITLAKIASKLAVTSASTVRLMRDEGGMWRFIIIKKLSNYVSVKATNLDGNLTSRLRLGTWANYSTFSLQAGPEVNPEVLGAGAKATSAAG